MRPPCCNSTANAKKDATVVKEEYTKNASLRKALCPGLLLRTGYPAKYGTKGNAKKDPSGSPVSTVAVLEMTSHIVDATFAMERAVKSL
jgi:hypothetical protein